MLFWYNMPESERPDILCNDEPLERAQSHKLTVVGGNSEHDYFSVETYCSQSKAWTLSTEKI